MPYFDILSSVNSTKLSNSSFAFFIFEYHIPVYQRPYAWTEDETGKLFDDLYDFFCTRSPENYFLILGRSANRRKEWMKLDGRTIAQVGQ